jgi:hypothetical protein
MERPRCEDEGKRPENKSGGDVEWDDEGENRVSLDPSDGRERSLKASAIKAEEHDICQQDTTRWRRKREADFSSGPF